MLQRPIFKPHLDLAIVPDEGVFLLSGSTQVVLRGRLYELIAPHVDGRAADDVCDRVSSHASPAEVYFTLSQLEKKGCLTEVDEVLEPNERAWWSLQKVDPVTASSRLKERSVSVHSVGIDPRPLVELLELSGVQVDADGEFSVVVVDHYLRPEIAAFNDVSLAKRRPWLLAKPFGIQLWMGPLFLPGKTGCWKCLSERLRCNRAVESYLRERRAFEETSVVDRAGTLAAQQAAWGLTANTILSWIVRGDLPDYEGKLQTFDQLSWQMTPHTLIRLPYCSACSKQSASHVADAAEHNGSKANGKVLAGHQLKGNGVHSGEGEIRPLVFERRKKTSFSDGGNRVVSPEETINRFGHHVSPITGAVSMLERRSGDGDDTMHVYLAGQNLAHRHKSLGQLRSDLRNMSAGKGMTDAQAKASGLCEGLERHSGVFRGDEQRLMARLSDLGAKGIDPRECLLFSARQYRERNVTNARTSYFNFVPDPFDPNAQIEWSPVWSLSGNEVRYVPTAFCYYDYPYPTDWRYCIACSNGNAAGNTLEEAVLQGFLELVERDSVALWWYNRIRRPGVDLASFQEPYLAKVADCLQRHERELFVLDLTSDLQIPVFAAWSQRTNTSGPSATGEAQIVLGFGAHLDAKIALLRAVTEMNQMLSHLLYAPPDKVYSDHVNDLETVHWLRTATPENQPYLLPNPDLPRKTKADFKSALNDDVALDVYECQRLVEGLGLEMLVLDQTRPEVGLPVVKVIVPGLRHFWARFAPGRLFEVPVALGWLDRPLAEVDLNPIPMFL